MNKIEEVLTLKKINLNSKRVFFCSPSKRCRETLGTVQILNTICFG